MGGELADAKQRQRNTGEHDKQAGGSAYVNVRRL
jgi:hypothetical protein